MSTVFWNLYARWYDLLRTLHPYERLHTRVVELMQLMPRLRVLDVGCGTGNTIEKVLAKGVHGIHVTGLDRSTSMLARAGRKLRSTRMRLTHSIGVAERFDRIISVNSFYTMENREDIVLDWYRRLEDGGLLVIVNPFRPKLFDIFREHFRTMWEKNDWRGAFGFMFRSPLWLLLITSNLIIAKLATTKVYAFLEPKELEAMFTAVGFTKLSEEVIYGDTCVLYSFKKKTEEGVRKVQTYEELEAGLRLRYSVYCNETESLDHGNYPDGLECDHFDPFAVHFMSWHKGEVTGYMRLVRGEQGALLMEDSFTLPSHLEAKRHLVIEVSRWIVAASHRGTGLWFALVGAASRWGHKNGYSTFVMAARENLWEGLKKRGLDVELWGGYQQYHGTFSAPGAFRVVHCKDV